MSTTQRNERTGNMQQRVERDWGALLFWGLAFAAGAVASVAQWGAALFIFIAAVMVLVARVQAGATASDSGSGSPQEALKQTDPSVGAPSAVEGRK